MRRRAATSCCPASRGCGKLAANPRPPLTPAYSPLVNKISWSVFAGVSPTTAEPPALGRFVILSMLVHFLLVVLFGNTTGTSSSPGSSLSTPLGVRLQPLSSPSGAGLKMAPALDPGALGTVLLRTLTGAKPPPTPRPPEVTRQAKSAPVPPAANREESSTQASEAAQPARDAAPAAQPPKIDPLPGLNFSAPELVDRPLKPSAIVPVPVERPPAPPADLPAREVPPLPPAPIERIIVPKVEQPIVPPAAPAPREAPKAPAPATERMAPPKKEPAPIPVPEQPAQEIPVAKPLPVAPVTPPKIEPVPTTPVEAAPREVPVAPAIPIERVAPTQIERPVTPPAEMPQAPVPVTPPTPVERIAPPKAATDVAPVAQPKPREVPVPPPAALEKAAPPSIERTITPPVERAAREAPVAPAPAAASTPAPAAPAAPATPPTRATLAPSGQPTGTPAEAPPRQRVGTSDGRDDIFKPRPEAAPPATQPGSAPRLNLDAVRQRAREIATEGSGSRGFLPLQIPVPAERKSKLADDMEKAIKPDCRNAYANMGLLAVPALVAGAVADVGCRW